MVFGNRDLLDAKGGHVIPKVCSVTGSSAVSHFSAATFWQGFEDQGERFFDAQYGWKWTLDLGLLTYEIPYRVMIESF